MKKLLIPLTVLMLAGCATHPVVIDAPPAASQKLRFVLEDRRPPKEGKGGLLSYMVTNCNYGVRRLAEITTAPGKLEVLGADLQELAGERLAGKTVTVTSYALFQNQANEFRALTKQSSGFGSIGLAAKLGSDIVDSGSGCAQGEMEGGWYDSRQAVSRFSPYVLELKLSIDGKPYAARVVRFPESVEQANNRLPAWGLMAREMFRQVAKNVVTELESGATVSR